MFADEKTADDSDFAIFCWERGGECLDEGSGCGFEVVPMFGEGESGVEFNPKTSVGFRGTDGRDW
jgi:hypothetical protein